MAQRNRQDVWMFIGLLVLGVIALLVVAIDKSVFTGTTWDAWAAIGSCSQAIFVAVGLIYAKKQLSQALAVRKQDQRIQRIDQCFAAYELVQERARDLAIEMNTINRRRDLLMDGEMAPADALAKLREQQISAVGAGNILAMRSLLLHPEDLALFSNHVTSLVSRMSHSRRIAARALGFLDETKGVATSDSAAEELNRYVSELLFEVMVVYGDLAEMASCASGLSEGVDAVRERRVAAIDDSVVHPADSASQPIE